MKREKRSNKLLQRLGSLLLALALVLGMTAGGPSMKAKADTPVVHPTGGKAAPKEVEFTEEELAQIDAEWEAVEKNTCTVSKAAADYWKSFGTDYYYNKLSATEKALWDDMENKCIALLESTEDASAVRSESYDFSQCPLFGKDPNSSDYYPFWLVFCYSNPQYYFLQNRFGGSSDTFMVKVYDEFQDGDARKEATAQFKAKADEWVAQIKKGSRDEDKVKICFDILCNNVWYNGNNPRNQSAYSTLIDGSTVCAGYSMAFTMLMNAAGVDAAPNTSDGHAWNIVNLHGSWYEIDATWGDSDTWIDYEFYNTSDAGIAAWDRTSESHVTETTFLDLVPQCPYDTLENDEYHSGYFSDDNGVYFVRSEGSGKDIAVMVEKKGEMPGTASAFGRTYTVAGYVPPASNTTPDVEQNQLVRNFVSRFYSIILERDADEAGLNDWTTQLVNGQKTGAEVARGFVLSKEFEAKNTSNEVFVKKLYRAFFDREADEGGYNGWMKKLSEGVSRKNVLVGFVKSAEFKNLCDKFGITVGTLEEDPAEETTQPETQPEPETQPDSGLLQIDSSNVDRATMISYFQRVYQAVLGRDGEADGVNYWTDAVMNGQDANGNVYDPATAIRKGFFQSKEYLAKNRTDEEYITDVYHAFFGREPDADGFADWKNRLANGEITKDQLIDIGFGHSLEFRILLEKYGFVILN